MDSRVYCLKFSKYSRIKLRNINRVTIFIKSLFEELLVSTKISERVVTLLLFILLFFSLLIFLNLPWLIILFAIFCPLNIFVVTFLLVFFWLFGIFLVIASRTIIVNLYLFWVFRLKHPSFVIELPWLHTLGLFKSKKSSINDLII